MKGLQLDAMGDADDGGLRQLGHDDLHHLVLALFVERGGRLVQHDDVGVVQQQPREGQPLLFAAGQRLVPRRVFLDLLLEVIEADLVQGLADLLERPVLGGAGIGDRAAQRAGRDVGLLRQHEEPAVGMEIDAAAAPRPQPRDRAHQRALAGAGFAGHQQPLAGLDHDFGFADHGGAVVERHREIVEAEHGVALGLAALDAADAVAALGALEPVERHHQRGDAARAGVPVGEPRIIVDQPAERGLHDGEGGGRLHHLSERHAAVEKFRRAQQERHHRRDQARSLRHQRGAHVLAGEPRPLPQHLGKGLVDAVALFLLAAEQRDAFAVLAHARQRVAVFGLGLVLVLGDLHEAAADRHDRAGGDRGIEHRGDHEEAGNGDGRSGNVTVSAPPMVQSTTMKVAADRNAEVTPAMKSTGKSVAIRRSSAMRT